MLLIPGLCVGCHVTCLVEADHVAVWLESRLSPLTAGAAYIGFFTQLLPRSVPPFKHGEAIMCQQSTQFQKS